MLAVLLAITALGGCKPSEKSYREAYETAVSGRRDAEREYLDSTALARLNRVGRPQRYAVGSDTLEAMAEVVSLARGIEQPGATLSRFGVVTGSFRQIFNAKEMLARLQGLGYSRAAVVQTSEKRYLVTAEWEDSASTALEALRRVGKDTRLGLKTPYPWVIRTQK